MVAFANTDGGRLLIGVRDNGSIAGIRTGEEIHMIETAARIYARPEVIFRSRVWNTGGKKVLEVKLEKGKMRPYYARSDDGNWLAWVRVGDENILAPDILEDYWQRLPDSRGVVMEYGIPERFFLRMLEKQGRLQPSQYEDMTGMSHSFTARMIADFMLMGVVGIEFRDGEPYYYLKQASSDS